MPNQRVICSIFFDDLKAVLSRGPTPDGPFCTTYALPAIERGAQGHRYQLEKKDGSWQWIAYPLERKGFNLLVVGDMFEREYRGVGKYGSNPVYADTGGVAGVNPNGGIAWSLVTQWATNRMGSSVSRIGVFICAGDEPTDEELKAAEASQTALCQWVVAEADDKWIKGQRSLITDFPPKAARWLGDTGHPWVADRRPVNMVLCPMCGESISSGFPICPHCHKVVDFTKFQQYEENRIRVESTLEQIRAKMTVEDKAAMAPLSNEEAAEALGAKIPPPSLPGRPSAMGLRK